MINNDDPNLLADFWWFTYRWLMIRWSHILANFKHVTITENPLSGPISPTPSPIYRWLSIMMIPYRVSYIYKTIYNQYNQIYIYVIIYGIYIYIWYNPNIYIYIWYNPNNDDNQPLPDVAPSPQAFSPQAAHTAATSLRSEGINGIACGATAPCAPRRSGSENGWNVPRLTSSHGKTMGKPMGKWWFIQETCGFNGIFWTNLC